MRISLRGAPAGSATPERRTRVLGAILPGEGGRLRRLVAVVLLLVEVDAHAAFWDQPRRVGYTAGVSFVVNLGRADDRARVGATLDAGYQWFWQDLPYYSDDPRRVAPLVTASAHLGWTHPVVWLDAALAAGPMYPAMVGDGGFIPLIGGQVGAGLGLATDGWAGPLLTAGAVGPWVEGRAEAAPTKDGWHAPRIAVGPSVELNCCSYYL